MQIIYVVYRDDIKQIRFHASGFFWRLSRFTLFLKNFTHFFSIARKSELIKCFISTSGYRTHNYHVYSQMSDVDACITNLLLKV